MLALESETKITGIYGSEPRVESITLLRNELYRRIESDVRDWVNDQRFIPRFLIAAGTFLVVYLFLTLVIRDPLPIVDEALVGGAAGVAAFVLVGRRFENSRAARHRRVALRAKVDGVVFTESPFVVQLEPLFHKLEQLEPAVQEYEESVLSEASELRSRYPDEVGAIVSHLRHMAGTREYRALSRGMGKPSLPRTVSDAIEAGTTIPGLLHLLRVLHRAD